MRTWPPALTLDRLLRRRRLVRRDRPEPLGDVAVALLDELHLEHRLEHGMIVRPDRIEALRRQELPALERLDHLVDVVAPRLLDRPYDHLRSHEPVGGEQV